MFYTNVASSLKRKMYVLRFFSERVNAPLYRQIVRCSSIRFPILRASFKIRDTLPMCSSCKNQTRTFLGFQRIIPFVKHKLKREQVSIPCHFHFVSLLGFITQSCTKRGHRCENEVVLWFRKSSYSGVEFIFVDFFVAWSEKYRIS